MEANDESEEYEVEYEESETYPEEVPQAGANVWDVARILTLPLLGLSRGFASMIDQGYGLLIHMSETHDAKKAAEEMEKAFK